MTQGAPEADAGVQQFGLSLVLMAKAVVLYPSTNSIVVNAARDTLEALSTVLKSRTDLHLTLTRENMWDNGAPVLAETASNKNLLHELYRRRLADIRFKTDVSASDLLALLSVLRDAPEDLEKSGGIEGRLREHHVTAIVVKEPALTIFGDPSATDSVSREAIDEMLTSAAEGSQGSRRAVVLGLLQPGALVGYFAETAAAHGARGVAEVGDRFVRVARVAQASEDHDRDALIAAEWEAVMSMAAGARAELLADELLPAARSDEAVVAAVRSTDPRGLYRILAEGAAASQVSREGLARALRAIAQISHLDPVELEKLVREEMELAGVDPQYAAETLALAMPGNPVFVQGAMSLHGDAPATAILALMDLAPKAHELPEDDNPELRVLAEEARVGITDGDVVLALVSLLCLDRRPGAFDSTIAVLEDSFDVLLERGEIDVAVEAAEALGALADDCGLSAEQKQRLNAAVGRLAKPSGIRELAQALRFHEQGSAERDSAERLIDSLGRSALGPMLEHLANESDMAVRKALVESLSRVATSQIEVVGSYVQDPRWYMVRNVVSILGSTRSAAALPYLARAQRHPDARVRREAIRALAGIPAAVAQESLALALSDSEAQNVQIAARYLGASGGRAAIRALSAVAMGEGAGNRDMAPRKEAIEALGKIGGPEALKALRQVSSLRSLLAGGKVRELRAVADAAIARIERQGGGA